MLLISQRDYDFGKSSHVSGLESDYYSYFEKWNIPILIIPFNTKRLKNYLEKYRITHIVLSGGNDINPSYYNQQPVFVNDCSIPRDEYEWEILEFAVKNSLPVLGICRGMQFINVFFGGQLIQNISKQVPNISHSPGTDHKIIIFEEKIMRSIQGSEVVVNSFHNQAVIKEYLSPKLKSFAEADDNTIIEGLFHTDLPIAGIQWHPERMQKESEMNNLIINAFINNELYWRKI